MDVSATTFPAAWLDAVRRPQSRPSLLPERIAGQETLTDMLEGALRTGGYDSLDTGWIDPAQPLRQLVARPDGA